MIKVFAPVPHTPPCPWSYHLSRGTFAEMDGTPREELPVPYPRGLSRPHEPALCSMAFCLRPGVVCTGDKASPRPLLAHGVLPSTFLCSISVLLNTCEQGFVSVGGPE